MAIQLSRAYAGSLPGVGYQQGRYGKIRVRTAGSVGTTADLAGQQLFEQIDSMLSAKGEGEQWAIQTLMSVGDSYENIVKEYKGDITDIIGKMNTDIDNAYTYMNETYNPYVAEQKEYFAGDKGIKVEESDAQRRSTYMGNVVSQAASSEAAQRRQMAAQGLNPYANAGNQRAMSLSRNASMAGAGNQAYNDWMQAHNQQRQMDQQARATYADMLKSPMDVQLGIMQARGMPLQAMSDMMNIEAQGRGLQADAAGKLLDYNSTLRSQGLQANQAKLNYASSLNDANAGLQAKMADANQSHFQKGVRVF